MLVMVNKFNYNHFIINFISKTLSNKLSSYIKQIPIF
jgi:hypothetical protein